MPMRTSPKEDLNTKAIASAVSRRALLGAGLSAAGLVRSLAQAPAVLTSKNRVATAACVLSPEETEGPYYIDQRVVRRDITEGRQGIPLRLRVTVLDATRCAPLANAAVGIWHCDAGGIYSGFSAQSMHTFGPPPRSPNDSARMAGDRPFGPPPGSAPPDGDFDPDRPPGPPPPGGMGNGGGGFGAGRPFRRGPSDKLTYLRGVQLTDADGTAEFGTIYPGWYFGRAIHIHLKVYTGGTVGAQYTGGHVCHTGQLFLPEEISDAVVASKLYADHRGQRTRQDDDNIFHSAHGTGLILSLDQSDKRRIEDGFVAKAVLGVDPNAKPREVGPGGRPGGPFPRNFPG